MLQPRWQSVAQKQAARIYGFDDTHVGVLSNPEVTALVNSLLGQMAP